MSVVALLATACGGASQPTGSAAPRPSGSGIGSISLLQVGLSANLDKLASYKFTESNVGSSSGTHASLADGSYQLAGTVVRAPQQSIWIKEANSQFISIGPTAWTSVDGTTWMAADPQSLGLSELLPGVEYQNWFDARVSYFVAVGEEPKNGVDCLHYQGNSALNSIYSGQSGDAAAFRADVWIAKDGNYPVSGFYGMTTTATASASATGTAAATASASALRSDGAAAKASPRSSVSPGGSAGAGASESASAGAGASDSASPVASAGASAGSPSNWGFQFDITDVNAASNVFAQPTNVVAYPT